MQANQKIILNPSCKSGKLLRYIDLTYMHDIVIEDKKAYELADFAMNGVTIAF